MKIRTTYIITLLTIIIGLTSFVINEKDEKTFYNSGKVKWEYFFDSNCNCHRNIEYFENGNIKSKKQYSTLGIDGTDTFFFENGKPSVASEYKNGTQVGKQIAFYEDGKTAYEQTYKDGYKVGTWKYLDILGMLYKTIEYPTNVVLWNSDLETNTTKYFKAGKLYLIETFIDNKKIKTEIIDKELFEEFENGELKTGEGLFISNCSMCHFKKDELFAPNMKNLTNNHNETWLFQKISNDEKLIDDKDNQALKGKWQSGKHPNFENLTEQEIKRIIKYIK